MPVTRKKAFTMIELLIVIGVLIILVGIVLLGLRHVTERAKTSATQVALSNAASMLAELDAAAKLSQRTAPPKYHWRGSSVDLSTSPYNNADLDFWVVPSRAPQNSNGDPQPIEVPKGVRPGDPDRGNEKQNLLGHWTIRNTTLTMAKLQSVPAIKQMIQKLPADQVMPSLTGLDPPATAQRYPILLDGWRNPILFVPGSGLCGVDSASDDHSMWVGGLPGSSGAKQVVANPTGPSQVGPIRSRDKRPFFASAGPDGDFTTGDDNVYSFDQ